MSSSSQNIVGVHKIGGANMERLDQVNGLMDILAKNDKERVLVVSAFKGVTDTLFAAMDTLNGKEYTEASIDAAFAETKRKHEIVIDKFFQNKNAARETYEAGFAVVKQALMTHQSVKGTILMSVPGSFEIRDQVIGFGENMAALLLAQYLREQGKRAHAYENVTADTSELNGEAHGEHGSTESGEQVISNRKLQKAIQGGVKKALRKKSEDVESETIQIFGGHIAGTPRGMVPHQGRGYSDITAVDVAAALQSEGRVVDGVTFWKDVDGYYTANPKELGEDGTRKVHHHRGISIHEALETAAAGSQILNVSALSRARQSDVSLEVRNIEKPDGIVFTKIGKSDVITNHAFKTIVTNSHIDTLTVEIPEMADQDGFMSTITEIFTKHGVSIDGIFTEGTSITFSIPMPRDNSEKEMHRDKIRTIENELKTVTVKDERYSVDVTAWSKGEFASLSLVGRELRDKRGILGYASGILGAFGINIQAISHGGLQTRISFLIDEQHREKATQILHAVLVERDSAKIAEYKVRRDAREDELSKSFESL